MFEISDVMIDKQEVAMSLNIKISVSDEEAFTDEYPINFSVSKNICSVSDFEISTILEKVSKILSLQGFACISCAQIECKAMAKEGVRIGAITIQNEPKAIQTWESCFYSPEDECEFIDKYLIDALDEEGLSDIKIMIWDHNKERVYDRAKKILSNERVNKRVWAVSHHWYSGDHFEGLRLVYEQFGKALICGEFCGPITEDVNVLAEKYGIEICENFNNFEIASCDWNLLLDQKGGPYHNRTKKTEGHLFENKEDGCYAPILYDTDKSELIITPIYYYIGHFSKFVERGAVRIATTKHSKDLYTCAFVNPDGKKVCIIINISDKEQNATLRYNDGCTNNIMKPHSIVTVIF